MSVTLLPVGLRRLVAILERRVKVIAESERRRTTSMLGVLARWIVRGVVHLVASFVAAVLEHEAVQAAGVRTMVRAMNEFLTQPDLHQHVRAMSETMAKNQDHFARSAGQDFPKLAGQFFQGLLSPHWRHDDNNNDNKLEQAGSGDQAAAPTTTATATGLAHGETVESPHRTATSTSPPTPSLSPPDDVTSPTRTSSFLEIPALLKGLAAPEGLRQRSSLQAPQPNGGHP